MKKLCLLLALILMLGCAVPAYAYEIEDEPEPNEPAEPYVYIEYTYDNHFVEIDPYTLMPTYSVYFSNVSSANQLIDWQ